MKSFFICFMLIGITACSSSTVIKTTDPDARIYVNDEYVGTGQATYTDTKVAFSKNDVKIERPGCAADSHTFTRNEKAEAGAIFSGFFVLVPWLWITEYKPERSYEYDCTPAEG